MEAIKGFGKSHPAQPSPNLPQVAVTPLSLLLAPPQPTSVSIAVSFQDLLVRSHLWGRVIFGGPATWGASPLISELWVLLDSFEYLEVGEGTRDRGGRLRDCWNKGLCPGLRPAHRGC